MPEITHPSSAGSDPRPLPLQKLKGIGAKTAEVFGKLGIHTLGDLLSHFPRRYEDRSDYRSIHGLQEGETATLIGTVIAVENRPTKTRLTLTRVSLEDAEKGVISLVWFNQWRLKGTFEKLQGKQIAVYGTVKRGFSVVEMAQPEWEELDEAGAVDSLALGRIVPVYALTEGLAQKALRRAVWNALEAFAERVPDPLPASLRQQHGLLPLSRALRQIHFPDSLEQMEAARRRLAYEELLVMQLALAERRQEEKRREGIAFARTDAPIAELQATLPFTLTEAQKRVIAEIAADMAAPRPMNRLIQGDVGSGKTAVAMAALLIAARNGYQSALMAPTEILAEQHLRGIRPLLEELGVRVDLLTGSRPAREKEAVRQRIAAGETGVVVGTHALIQEGVRFSRLGLAVIDEQHRFGVLQRAALTGKGGNPDVLVMTATPIPRTLTLTVYGDLDVSVIDQLPPGRQPVRTHWKRSGEKSGVYDGVRKLIQAGRQAYVVCPLVEESEKLTARAATELAEHLARHVFPEYQVALLHGQMPSEEKDAAMQRFRANTAQIMVATTVIEVGVDVPNAAVMVIEDADRFGLAQLHQLRGRVGRGQHASFCILIADPKGPDGMERMQVMTATTDGFRIAEEDLRLRGPGDFYGVRQSGIAALKIADVLRDREMLRLARADAFHLKERNPELSGEEYRELRQALQELQKRSHAAELTGVA